MLDGDACWRAMLARDARFDGRFFVGVSTTGVYCRPICPARTPRRDRCTFHANAAAAEKAGFRACFRCRPELAPGQADVDAVSRLVAGALGRIDEGYLDDASVDSLAREFGVTARHLRRVFEAELGVSPIELAQTRRLARAKQLLHDSELSLTAIAYASGFRSLRRFNAAMHERFGQPPSALRRRRSLGRGRVSLRLDHRPPLDFEALLEFLRPRAWAGVEFVDGDVWRRRIGEAEVRVFRDRSRDSLRLELDVALVPALARIVAGVRRLFDLDAEPGAIASVLRRDRLLAPLVRRRPGLRVPGAFDPFEAALRGVLGQQISVPAATTLGGRMAAHFGGVPSPAVLAGSSAEDIAALGMPLSRARAIIGLASAWDTGAIACMPGASPEQLHAAIVAIPGLGPWTAEYLCMRALHFPDALPAGDLGVRKALGGCSAAEVRRRAEAWRPWRAYAVMHLWTALARGELPA